MTIDRATETQIIELVMDGVPGRAICKELGIKYGEMFKVKRRAGLVGRHREMERAARSAVIQEYVVRRGLTYAEASKEVGYARNTLRRWAMELGKTGAYEQRIEERRAEVYPRWLAGETQKALATKYGVHVATIQRDVKIMRERENPK